MKKRQQNNKTHTNVNESGTMLHILRRKTWICVNVSGWNFICLLNHLSFFFWRWSVIFHSKLSIGLCGNRFQQRLSSLFYFFLNILFVWLGYSYSGVSHFNWSIRWTLSICHSLTLTQPNWLSQYIAIQYDLKKKTGDENRIQINFSFCEFMALSPIKNIRRLNFMMLTYRLNEIECQFICVSTTWTYIFVRRFCWFFFLCFTRSPARFKFNSRSCC